MQTNYDKLIALTQKLDEKLLHKDKSDVNLFDFSNTTNTPAQDELSRAENLKRLKLLFSELGIDKKCANLEEVYLYKAMNLGGIGIGENDFGEIRAGKYVQIIAISYEVGPDERKKAKNVSLGYFGNGSNLTTELKNKIIEFVLRWRYEKGFQSQDHYKLLLGKIIP